MSDELLPEETLFIHMVDIQRIREGHWLTIDGEFYEVVEISDEAADQRYAVRLRNSPRMPEDRSGYIGTFYRTGETLNLQG